MNARLENIPNEPPDDVEQVVELTGGEKEKLAQLAVMLKAYRLFSIPRDEDDPYRAPDDIKQYELITETMSFLKDKEERRRLVYRRIETDRGELVLDSQVIEFRESDTAVPIVITCDRFPEGEVPYDTIQKVEVFLDDHLKKYSLS